MGWKVNTGYFNSGHIRMIKNSSMKISKIEFEWNDFLDD